jgi:hypothetical protein
MSQDILDKIEQLLFDRDTITEGIDQEIASLTLELESLQKRRESMIITEQGLIDDLITDLRGKLTESGESLKGRRLSFSTKPRRSVDLKQFDKLIEDHPEMAIFKSCISEKNVVTLRGDK